MSKKIILRFRDLITEDDGTINDHQNLINDYGEVWWGWWMKQKETPPRELFKEISNEIKKSGFATAYLFNTGLHKFYETHVTKILLAPENNTISTPDPQTSPTYYHRGSYPAWLLFNKIRQVDFADLKLKYHSFPTTVDEKYENLVGETVQSLNELEDQNVTLWVIETEDKNATVINN